MMALFLVCSPYSVFNFKYRVYTHTEFTESGHTDVRKRDMFRQARMENVDYISPSQSEKYGLAGYRFVLFPHARGNVYMLDINLHCYPTAIPPTASPQRCHLLDMNFYFSHPSPYTQKMCNYL